MTPSRTPLQRSLALIIALATVSFVALTAFAAPADATARRFSSNTGTGSGFKWTNHGPDNRDDSTGYGTGLKWKLNIAAPSVYNSDSYTKNAINAINYQSPGMPMQWGGITSATSVPTCAGCSNYENAWLIRMVPYSSFKYVCGTSTSTLGCARSYTSSWDGGKTFNVTSCIVYIDADKYKSGKWSSTVWHGAFRHEMGHCLGMAHYDSTYEGYYQIMKSVVTSATIRSGDRNGIRALTRKV